MTPAIPLGDIDFEDYLQLNTGRARGAQVLADRRRSRAGARRGARCCASAPPPKSGTPGQEPGHRRLVGAAQEPPDALGLLLGSVVRLREWGPLQEIRVRRSSGLEVEMGVVPVSWAATDPVEPGTRRVVSDGHVIVHDPIGLLDALSAACAREPPA